MAGTECKRLLVLSCSQRKRTNSGDLSALERYDSPTFRVLCKFLLSGESDVRLCVISARIGLLPPSAMVPLYPPGMPQGVALIFDAN